MRTTRIPIISELSVINARQAGRDLAKQLGFGVADQTRLATAISEITRNVLQYAGSGYCELSDESDHHTMKIKVIVEDQGPGIANIDRAMEFGFTTGKGLGVGLPGSQRLMSDFQIDSRPGLTRVIMSLFRQRIFRYDSTN